MGKLTNLKIKNAKPQSKTYKLSDGDNLYLFVKPTGYKVWVFRYRFQGKLKDCYIGPYPEISLSEAREKAFTLRKMVKEGKDPSIVKKLERASKFPTFKEIALEFLDRKKNEWSKTHFDTVKLRLEKYIFPEIGNIPIDQIKPLLLMNFLKKLEKRGVLETARRIRGIVGQILRYAIACGYEINDPTFPLKGTLPRPKVKHMPAVTTPEELREILKLFWAYPHSIIVRTALRLIVYLFPRPGELVSMQWKDVNLEKGEWRYILSKTYREHIVPLPRQVIKLLKELKILTQRSPYVFPSANSWEKHMSVEALEKALRRVGIPSEKQTVHGFRATARTILHEVLGWAPDIIEIALGHKVPDRLGEAYNRTKFLPQRRVMMQMWVDYIDALIEEKDQEFLEKLKTKNLVEKGFGWMNPFIY